MNRSPATERAKKRCFWKRPSPRHRSRIPPFRVPGRRRFLAHDPMTAPVHFIAPVLKSDSGYLRQHFIPVSPDIAGALMEEGSRRVVATLNGRPYRRAIQNNKDGEYFILLGRGLLREIGAQYGDEVVVELAPDPDPDYVELGEEFSEVLELDEEAAARFFAFTPGKQRGLAYYVNSAKRSETRIKRALEIAHKLKTCTLYGDKRPE